MGQKLQNDLTEGSVWRKLLRYALPLVLTSFLQALYGIVDTVVAGHYIGNSALSAIANASQVMSLVTGIAIGLTMGGNVIISQYFGIRDDDKRRKAGATLLIFALLLGAVLAAAVFILTPTILKAMGAPAYEDSCIYLYICAIGIFPTFGYNALAAMIRSVGNSRQPLYFIIAATVVNIVLDVWFVTGLEWGVAGTAIATLAAQVVTFVCALVFVLRNRAYYGVERKYLRVDLQILRRTLKVGIPSALQMIIGGASWMVVTVFINKYDVDASAAAGVVNKVRELLLMCISALGSGAGTMVAQNLGAGQYDRAKKVVHVTVGVNMLVAAVLIGMIQLIPAQLAGIFTSDKNALAIAVPQLRIDSICFVFYAGFMSLNAMPIGAGDSWFFMFNSFVNCIIARVGLLLLLEGTMGLTGIYWACAFAPAVSVPIGWAYLKAGKWRKTMVKDGK